MRIMRKTFTSGSSKMAAQGGYFDMSAQYAPLPPEDPEVRNIIDKLANFVARNGPEFEQMTMEKQRDNPKFYFLFGGELNAYYKWKVATEQASAYSQQQQQTGQQIPSLMSRPQPLMPQPQSLMSQSQPQSLMSQSQPQSLLSQSQPQSLLSQSQPQSLLSQSQPQSLLSQSHSTGYSQSYSQPQPLMQQGATLQAPPPWMQQQQQEAGLIQHLKQAKLQEQTAYQQGTPNPLEAEFGSVVQPIMDSCRKDSIASGKIWIFSHTKTPEGCHQVARFIMRKTLTAPGVGFTQKLHIIYLINDVIHHCLRKGAQDLQQAIEGVVVQIFYNVCSSDPDKSDSLMKVLKIWESQKYFAEPVLQQIRAIITEDPAVLADSGRPSDGAGDVAPQPPSLPPWQQQQQPPAPRDVFGQPPPMQPWQQHQPQQSAPPPWQPTQEFNAPWMQNAGSGAGGGAPPPWQQQQPPTSQPTPLFPPHEELPPPPPPPRDVTPPQEPRPPERKDLPELEYDPKDISGPGPEMESQPPTVREELPAFPSDGGGSEGPSQQEGQGTAEEEEPLQPGEMQTFEYNHQSRIPVLGGPPVEDEFQRRDVEVFEYNHRPIPWPPGGAHMGPPHLFPPDPHWRPPGPTEGPPRSEMPPPPDLPPPIPYFDLPAGLMAPLVPLHEHSYRPLNPMGVRLPPPQPPTDRLLKAVEEFYEPPSDSKPRSNEGWEARALLDFFEMKRRAKEDLLHHFRPQRRPPPPTRRRRSYSRSRSPSRSRSRSRSRSPYRRRRRRSRSYSRSRSRSRSHSRSRSRSRSDSRSRSRSRSPRYRRRRSSRSPSSGSRSSSRSRSRSRSPYRRRRRSRSRSRSRSPFIPTTRPPRRSPSPKRPAYHPGATANERITEGNVGHQMLKKMGWEGTGLGARHQGIQEPIKGGDVRDKQDKYKGVGVDLNDPFEQFRKNKSYTFNRRFPPSAPR